MLIATLVLTALGASGVLASDGVVYPHRRNPLRSRAAKRETRPRPSLSTRDDAKFLTPKTERKDRPPQMTILGTPFTDTS